LKLKQNLFDILLSKIISRKLFVFVLASYFLLQEILPSSDWTLIALIYIGAQGAIDFYQVFKNMQPQSIKENEQGTVDDWHP